MTKEGIKYITMRIRDISSKAIGKLGVNKPDADAEILKALATGTKLQLKSAAELVSLAKKAAGEWGKELKVVRMFEPPKEYTLARDRAVLAEARNKKLIEKISAVEQTMIDDVNTGLKGREAIDEFDAFVKDLTKKA